MINENIGIQQGWQCPICGRVYSPMTFMCYYCGGEQKTIITVGTSTETNNIETNPMNSYEQFVRKTMIGE